VTRKWKIENSKGKAHDLSVYYSLFTIFYLLFSSYCKKGLDSGFAYRVYDRKQV
jgi:hypothetical protein